MPKNIVICADGTGNTTVKGRGTNVFKLFEAVDGNGHRFPPGPDQQVTIYHDGVGTENLKWLRLLSGAFGWGLSRNVKQLYAELARVYSPGDRIFLFGFSRGAFTVRTLTGLITTCGILDVNAYGTNSSFTNNIRTAYSEYRRKYQTKLSTAIFGKRTVDPAVLRARFSVDIPGFADESRPVIQFIGVWDTVDAVGLPLRGADIINNVFWRFKFPDTTLSRYVGYAAHALALDEARHSFVPVLWDERDERPRTARIAQVWFAGVHSNVGGGYPRQGMSLVALDWMMTKAEQHGLRFLPMARDLYRNAADVNDKRYDSRTGLGVFYRWKPRDVQQLCQQWGITPQVHRTVFERIARNTEGYAPGTLPVACEVISTSASREVRDSIANTVTDAFAQQPPLLRRVPAWRRMGVVGYYLLLAATALLGGLMGAQYLSDARANGADWRRTVAALANTALSSHWLEIALRTLRRHVWLGAVAAIALTMLLWAESRLDAFYSAFWHTVRAKLKTAL